MWTRVNPECMFSKHFRGKLFENGKRYAKSETIQKALEERIQNHILHVQFDCKTSISQSNLLYPLYGVYVYNYSKRQKMPKCVKMFTLKWHQKQRHFFIHPCRSLQCIRFVRRKFFLSRTSLPEPIVRKEGGGEFSTILPFWAPLHFDRTKLAHAQFGYGAYTIRPELDLYGI